MEYAFTLPGPPLPWARARHRGKQYFTPKAMRLYQRRLQTEALREGVQLLSGPVEIEVTAYIASRKEAYLYGSGDLDNFLKQAKDSLIRIAYRDDCQVVDAVVRKRVDQMYPRLEVKLRGKPLGRALPETRPMKRRRPALRLVPAYEAPKHASTEAEAVEAGGEGAPATRVHAPPGTEACAEESKGT